jgi:3-oxoadipate enol-lactonase
MAVELNHRIDGSGPHVLLLHAVGMDLTLLEPLTAIMAKDFTVLRADLRGHGKSPYAPAASLEDYADDVHALLTKLSFAPCAVAGFAMGGMVTQALAVKYPQDTRAIMIASCAHEQTAESRAALLSRAESAKREGFAPILDETMQRWFTDGFIARGGDAPVRQRLLTDDLRAWVNAFEAMAHIDTAPRLKNIKVPALCMVGDADKSTPPPVVKAIADAIPGARFHVIPGGTHMPFFEIPKEVAKVVGGFFREALSTTSP